MASARPDLLLLSLDLAHLRIARHDVNASSCPKGKPDWRAYVNEFVEEAKVSGAVQRFMKCGGTRGVNVAPAADPS